MIACLSAMLWWQVLWDRATGPFFREFYKSVLGADTSPEHQGPGGAAVPHQEPHNPTHVLFEALFHLLQSPAPGAPSMCEGE